MNNTAINAELVRKYGQDVGGVFSLADLKALFPFLDRISFYRKIRGLESLGVLKRFSRGIYLAKDFDPFVLSQKLCSESYIGFETVLAKNMMIGTVPSRQLRAVKIGQKREYAVDDLSIVYLGLRKELFFGFENVDGVRFATKEKALLDTLYFYMKGTRFYFDIYSDIDLKKVDTKIIKKYLSRYKNPKFVKFVKKYLEEGTV